MFKHLALWDQKARPPPKATGPPKIQEYKIDYTDYQLPVSDNLSRASRSNEWLYVDPEYPETYPSGYLEWKNLHIVYIGTWPILFNIVIIHQSIDIKHFFW